MKLKAGRYDRLTYTERAGLTLEYRAGRPRRETSTAIAHELAHAIIETAHGSSLDPNLYHAAQAGRRDLRAPLLRTEVNAWRLAKSICKPGLWDEGFALRGLLSYVHAPQYMGRPYVKRCRQQAAKLRAIGIRPLYGPAGR